MKKVIFSSLLFAFAFVGHTSAQMMRDENPVVGGAAMYKTKNIVENAINSKDHTTLVAAVKAAGLVDTLASAGPFTVFAPTNAAFEKLPAGTVESLVKPENRATLTKILTYHVVAGNADSKSIIKAIKNGGGRAEFKTVAGGTLTAMMEGKNLVLTDEKGGRSIVTVADVRQSNGVIHVIDSVVMPNYVFSHKGWNQKASGHRSQASFYGCSSHRLAREDKISAGGFMKIKITVVIILTFVAVSAIVVTGQRAAKPLTGRTVSDAVFDGNRIVKSEAAWKRMLSAEAFYVLRKKGTERAYTGSLTDNKKPGVYACGACGLHLFSSEHKFDSGTGWPSFFDVIHKENVDKEEDKSLASETRTEVLCARCGSHLGHVFDDGPEPTGLRYCINSVALKFVPAK